MDKQIRADLRPAYYDEFHCLAAECQLSCCVGWRISFDKKDYLSLKHQSGSADLNARMEHGLRRIRKGPLAFRYGEFTMEGGRCPLLREDSLCALQLEKGHDALPIVCRSFPRAEAYRPSGYFERSLTPACEAVLGLLWGLPEGVDFRSDPLPKGQWRNTSWANDGFLLSNFQEIRSQCIDFLQDRRHSLPQRIMLLGVALKELADGEQDMTHWLNRAQFLMGQGNPVLNGADDQSVAMFLSHNLRVLFSLTNPNPRFVDLPKELIDDLGIQVQRGTSRVTMPTAPYFAARERFEQSFIDREYFIENLMVTVFFHLHLPDLSSPEALWKSYVNFCNLYSFYRFLSVMSCRESAAGGIDELFRLLVFASRSLIHNNAKQTAFRDEFFQNDSATLAHMAILLGG